MPVHFSSSLDEVYGVLQRCALNDSKIDMFSVRGDEKDQILVASPKAVACIFPIVCDFSAAGNTRKINLWSSPATCKTSG